MEEKNDTQTIREDIGPKEEIVELKKSLKSLEETISRINSTKKVVLRGIITGLSGAIGATIVFGLVLAIISWVFPELKDLISQLMNEGR